MARGGILAAISDGAAGAWQWAQRNPVLALGGLAGAVALGATGGAVASGAVSTGPGPRIAAGAYRSSVPANWAADYLAKMLRHWPLELGTSVRAMAPVVWPGVPPEVFMGFAMNGESATSNTAISANNRFSELGWWGTEAGPRSTPKEAGPYPHPTDPRDNTWLALHADPQVKALLGGREAPMANGAWARDVPAQTAIGLVNLRRRLDAVNRAIPADLDAADPASTWAVTLAFDGWSAGAGGMATHVQRYRAALAAVPESRRLVAWVAAIIADARRGNVHGDRHQNVAYSALRGLQKFEAGRLLATRTGGNAAWFPMFDARTQLELTAAAFNAPLPT